MLSATLPWYDEAVRWSSLPLVSVRWSLLSFVFTAEKQLPWC